MLRIYETDIDEIDESKFIRDVELGFGMYLVNGIDHKADSILADIDKATLVDVEHQVIIDRFGYRIYIDNLSTGCKAALLVLYKPDLIVDTVECGDNAIDCIIKNCRDGNIAVNNVRDMALICGTEKDKVDVTVRGREFHSTRELNSYINDDELEDFDNFDELYRKASEENGRHN